MTGALDTRVLDAYPGMPIDHDSKRYWAGCLEKRLLIARCADCRHWIHFPRPVCPRCWSARVEAEPVSGFGTVHLLTFYHQARGTGGVFGEPWPVAAVELAEQPGLRITSTLVECARERMQIGLPVELTWIEWNGAPVPAFRPRAAGA